MTEPEILNEADRINRRAAYAKKLADCTKEKCQLISFVCGEAGIRIDLDAPALGMLRKYLMDSFDAENPPHKATSA